MSAISSSPRRGSAKPAGAGKGRANQRLRTRKDLLDAASRLMKAGSVPSLEDVADAAMVSRATAYRYFSSADDLMVEAALDVAVPDPGELFAGGTNGDPVARLERVDAAIQKAIVENEVPFRMMLAQSLERRAKGLDDTDLPVRQNRRTPLIEKALEPARGDFDPAAYKALVATLAIVIGTESTVVFRDVLQMKDAEARKVRRWAIQALVEAAQRQKP